MFCTPPDTLPEVFDTKQKEHCAVFEWKKHVKEFPFEHRHHVSEHAQALLRRAAWNLLQVMASAGVNVMNVNFYDGGIADRAGLSHAIHDYEDLFVDDAGRVRSAEQYLEIVEQLHWATPDGREQMRKDNCATRSLYLQPTAALESLVQKATRVKWLLASPFTAFARCHQSSGRSPSKQEVLVVAMAGSWDGRQNLLGDNFNVQVDLPAYTRFIDLCAAGSCSALLVPTEVCKQPEWLVVDGKTFSGFGELAKLVDLWTALKGKPQPMFDLALMIPKRLIPAQLVPVDIVLMESEQCPTGFRATMLAGSNPAIRAFAIADCSEHLTNGFVVQWLQDQQHLAQKQ